MPLKHNVKEIELKNGAKGLIVDVPDASVFYYNFNFRAGNGYVKKPEIQQTAHILEHLAFNGTKKYPSAEKFSQIFTENGAYNNATTYEISVSYYGGSADFEVERIIDLQGQALCDPNFNEELLSKEKKTVREELVGQSSNYGRLLWQKLDRAMGSDMFTDEEKIETIDNVTLEDINEHYSRTHTTNSMDFILGGNLKGKRLDEIIKQIENFKLPSGSRLPIKQIKLKKANGPVMIQNKEVKNIYFILTMVLNRKMSMRESYVMRALTHTLTATMHSRIFGKARERGICYSMHSGSTRSAQGISDFQFMSQVTKENSKALYDLIISELNEVKTNGITEEELESVKKFSFGEYQLYGQTVGSIAYHYNSFFDDEDVVEMDKIADIINSITNEEIKKLTSEFIDSGIWGFGELGDVDKEANKLAYNDFSTKLFSGGEK